MAINKHGLKMTGLKAASGETKDYGPYDGRYVQISYDMSDGEILTDYHCSFGQNSWSEYHSDNIITVCNATTHMTMQEIADAVSDSVNNRRNAESYMYK